VKSLADVNVSRLEGGVEVKAVSKKDFFVKSIEIDLDLVNFCFENGMLVLEFELK